MTIDFDDITDDFLPDDVQAISLTAAKNLRVTAAVQTADMDNSDSWSTVQGWVDAGFTEAASHTRTHPCTDADYQVLGYTSEVVGSRDDLLSNLDLPNPFIPTFVEPCGFSDAELLSTVAAAGYLVNRSTNTGDNNFGAWDSRRVLRREYDGGHRQLAGLHLVSECRRHRGTAEHLEFHVRQRVRERGHLPVLGPSLGKALVHRRVSRPARELYREQEGRLVRHAR